MPFFFFKNNNINVQDRALTWDAVNNSEGEEAFSFTFNNNTIKSGGFAIIGYTNGGEFRENNMNMGIQFKESYNIIFDKNEIIGDTPYGVLLQGDLTDNITLSNNYIETFNTGGLGHGITSKFFTTSESKNINIINNSFKLNGYNSGVKIEEIHGITVKDNKGHFDLMPLIYYRGNNSTFSNNTILSGSNLINDIQGSNNSIN